jgi:hypothetical protein
MPFSHHFNDMQEYDHGLHGNTHISIENFINFNLLFCSMYEKHSQVHKILDFENYSIFKPNCLLCASEVLHKNRYHLRHSCEPKKDSNLMKFETCHSEYYVATRKNTKNARK